VLTHRAHRDAEVVVRCAGDRLERGDVAHDRRAGIATHGERADDDVSLGDEPGAAALLWVEHRQAACSARSHLACRVDERGIDGERDIGAHPLANRRHGREEHTTIAGAP
jgi:hypothetical protein